MEPTQLSLDDVLWIEEHAEEIEASDEPTDKQGE